jgi:hypothetical protein
MIAAGRLLLNATTRWPAAADGLLLNATTRWPAKITLKVKTVLPQIGKHGHQVGPKFDFVEVKFLFADLSTSFNLVQFNNSGIAFCR